MELRQAGVRPVTLAVAPVTATTPGHLWQLALQPGGFHLRAYSGVCGVPAAGSQAIGNWGPLHTRVRPLW